MELVLFNMLPLVVDAFESCERATGPTANRGRTSVAPATDGAFPVAPSSQDRCVAARKLHRRIIDKGETG
jgi:hypothetical protein